MRIITVNEIDETHLLEVIEEMKSLGTPTIKAFWDGEIYWAAEGSHRLVAAHQLGLTPEIEEYEYNDDTITVQWDGSETDFVAHELFDTLLNNHNNLTLDFD